eukprot:gene7521-10244_t
MFRPIPVAFEIKDEKEEKSKRRKSYLQSKNIGTSSMGNNNINSSKIPKEISQTPKIFNKNNRAESNDERDIKPHTSTGYGNNKIPNLINSSTGNGLKPNPIIQMSLDTKPQPPSTAPISNYNLPSSPVAHIRKLTSRPNTSVMRKPVEEPMHPRWNIGSLLTNRDILNVEQTVTNIKKIPTGTLDPSKCSTFVEIDARAVSKEKSIIRRERFSAKTSGPILNNSLPYYPELKRIEMEQKAKYANEDWAQATLPYDDPVRLRPTEKVGKSQESFLNEFHNKNINKLSSNSYNEIKVTKNLSSILSMVL